jgi:hypothetical protein
MTGLFRRQGRALAEVMQAAVDPHTLGLDTQPVCNEILKMGREIGRPIGFDQGGEFAALAPSYRLRALTWGDVFDSGL